MTQKELLQNLQSRVSESEQAALNSSDSTIYIGKYNREIIKTMLQMQTAGEKTVDEQKIAELTACLQEYLEQYMEQKEGHKWVILASIFNTFVLEMPMHPMEVTHVRTVIKDGKAVYICPAREDQEGSACRYCVCRNE